MRGGVRAACKLSVRGSTTPSTSSARVEDVLQAPDCRRQDGRAFTVPSVRPGPGVAPSGEIVEPHAPIDRVDEVLDELQNPHCLVFGRVTLEVLHPSLRSAVVSPHALVEALDEVLDELPEGFEHRRLILRVLGEVDGPDRRRSVVGDIALDRRSMRHRDRC